MRHVDTCCCATNYRTPWCDMLRQADDRNSIVLHLWYKIPMIQEEIDRRSSYLGKFRRTEEAQHLLDLIRMSKDEEPLFIPFAKAAMVDIFDVLNRYAPKQKKAIWWREGMTTILLPKIPPRSNEKHVCNLSGYNSASEYFELTEISPSATGHRFVLSKGDAVYITVEGMFYHTSTDDGAWLSHTWQLTQDSPEIILEDTLRDILDPQGTYENIDVWKISLSRDASLPQENISVDIYEPCTDTELNTLDMSEVVPQLFVNNQLSGTFKRTVNGVTETYEDTIGTSDGVIIVRTDTPTSIQGRIYLPIAMGEEERDTQNTFVVLVNYKKAYTVIATGEEVVTDESVKLTLPASVLKPNNSPYRWEALIDYAPALAAATNERSAEYVYNVDSVELQSILTRQNNPVPFKTGDYVLYDDLLYIAVADGDANDFAGKLLATEDYRNSIHYAIKWDSTHNINMVEPLDTGIFEALVARVIYKWLQYSYPNEAQRYLDEFNENIERIGKRCDALWGVHIVSRIPRCF